MTKNAIIVGGTGHLGISLSNLLLKKDYNVFVTTRKKKIKFKNKFKKKLKFIKLNIYNKIEIKKIIKQTNPSIIFYFAGQSRPEISFNKKKETFNSNVIGCKNFLEGIKNFNQNCKFVNSASSEMYGHIKGRINFDTNKNPVNPYGYAKAFAFDLTKKYRNQFNLKFYNAIIFNTESIYRKKNHLIPKICLAALKAKKNKKITTFGNLNISREWNWADDQMKYLLKFINKVPQDFILSNGKNFKAKDMLKYAFKYFSLDYKKFIKVDKKFYRKNDVQIKKSNYLRCLNRNNLKRKDKYYGKKLINKLINYYKNELNSHL